MTICGRCYAILIFDGDPGDLETRYVRPPNDAELHELTSDPAMRSTIDRAKGMALAMRQGQAGTQH